MVDVLSRDLPTDSQAPTSTDAFDPIAHFNRPLFGDGADRRAVSAIYDGLPPLGGMTLGLQTVAAPADAPASNEDQLAPPTRVPAMRPPVDCELADVLPDVTKVELMRLALQHFGGRFSMIGNLARLGLAYLKGDGSYLRAIDEENDKRLFIEAIYRASNSIDLPLIAEMVETQGELDVLKELGIQGAMGRLIGAPEPWQD